MCVSGREEWKRDLRWNGTRICANCLHSRELTEEEVQRFKNWPYGDKPDLFCTHTNKKAGIKPGGTPGWSHCFCHEYDDESVLLPKNPKWNEGEIKVNDLWTYEQERAEALRLKRAQVCMEL